MSKIMDRVKDLNAVDWSAVSVETLALWEIEAIHHVRECRCHKCAVFFARSAPCDGYCLPFVNPRGSAISRDVIKALHAILKEQNKLPVYE